MNLVAHSEQETKQIGQDLSAKLQGGDVVLLYGELGAGKTTLAKGIAAGLGVKEEITSPTFTLMNVYKTPNTQLVHIDTYRLKNEQELVEIGAEDYIGQPDTITVIEWPEKIESLLKNKKTLKIKLEHFGGGRKIDVEMSNF